MPVQTQILTRRDTAANWTSTNPTLGNGEKGLETDTGLLKIGTGSTSWTNLNYFMPPFSNRNKMLSGRYYFPHWYGVTNTSGTSLSTMHAVPIIIPNTITVTSLNIEVTTAAAAGGVARLGIYSSNANNQPGSLVIDAGTVATDSIGVKELVTSQTLTAGVYWLSVAWQGNVTGMLYRFVTGIAPYIYSSAQYTISSSYPNCYYSTVSGALPSTFSITNYALGAPKMWIKT